MFTYELPFSKQKFFDIICDKWIRENKRNISDLLNNAFISIEDLGTSYYVDGSGRWNAKGIQIKFYVKKNNISLLDNNMTKKILHNICASIIPAEVGYDIKRISFEENYKEKSLNDDELDNNVMEESFEVLASSIKKSIEEGQPVLALDRLHTYMVKYVRKLCDKHHIEYEKEEPLHSCYGKYLKQVVKEGRVECEMSVVILKTGISILDKFNYVRNNKSYAHDNDVLNNDESMFIYKTIVNIVEFINQIEG